VTAIHGDLVPPDIHIDAAGRPAAVLDFGFCTTAGEAAFEAAVTAAPGTCTGRTPRSRPRNSRDSSPTSSGTRQRPSPPVRHACALTTYDLFGLDDRDGHFRECAEQLRRNAVFSA
jgi:hypothetical protein